MRFTKKYPPIKYTARDFNSIRRELVEYAQRYYPNSFQDFNEAGFGSLMVDSVAYIGDILSFYLDYSVNESFLGTANEYENILKLGKQMGYRFPGNPSSFGIVDVYVIVPSLAGGAGVDPDYIPILKRGTSFSSVGGGNFALIEDINFADPTNEIVVGQVSDTSVPLSWVIKSSGQVISGIVDVETVSVGNFERFLNIELEASNISEIVSVVDSEGNPYYEVDYLAQDVVYRPSTNRGANKTITQAIMRPFIVPRRFVVQNNQESTFLQFGQGTDIIEENIEPLIDPSKAVIKMHGKNYYTDANFDPHNLLQTDKFGIAPADTTLEVVYRANEEQSANAAPGSVTLVSQVIWEFPDESILDSEDQAAVENSLEVNNEEPIVGDVGLPDADELKNRIFGSFSTQSRAVTQEDYKSLAYTMPPSFGAVKRVSIRRDPTAFKRNLNLYVVSEDAFGSLIATNTTIKENLKTWLNNSRMINDTIDILDAKIVNIGVDFTAISSLGSNKYDVLSDITRTLIERYNRKLEIGEAFYISDVYSEINKVNQVVDTVRVKITHKSGENYSSQAFNIEDRTSDDGMYLLAPDNVIFEIKYPDVDIKGTIR